MQPQRLGLRHLTGDRDSLQLVDPHVTVKLVRSQAGQTTTVNYTPAVFEAEYGFAPARLIDLKALMGDSSDNIPGVAGVGPKTAGDLLHKFGTLDGVYAHLDSPEIKAKLREKLENGREMAYLSYDLATIRCNAPLMDFAPEKNLVQPPKRRALYDLFTRLEFQKLIDRYQLRSAAFEETDDTEKNGGVYGRMYGRRGGNAGAGDGTAGRTHRLSGAFRWDGCCRVLP